VVLNRGSIRFKQRTSGFYQHNFLHQALCPEVSLANPQCEVAFEIIDLDRHGEIGATDLRRALQLLGKEEWKVWEVWEVFGSPNDVLFESLGLTKRFGSNLGALGASYG